MGLSVGELNDDDEQKDLDPHDPCNTDKDKEIEKASANPDDPCNTDEGNEIEKSSPIFDWCKSFMRSRSSRIGSVYIKISKASRRSIIDKKPKKKKGVNFSNVEIRMCDVTIGDHPDCRGAPVSLDWTYQDLDSSN